MALINPNKHMQNIKANQIHQSRFSRLVNLNISSPSNNKNSFANFQIVMRLDCHRPPQSPSRNQITSQQSPSAHGPLSSLIWLVSARAAVVLNASLRPMRISNALREGSEKNEKVTQETLTGTTVKLNEKIRCLLVQIDEMGLVGPCSETDEADSDVKAVGGFGICVKDDAREMKRREVEQMSNKEASDAASAVILKNVKATKPSTAIGLPVDAAYGDEMFLFKGTKESLTVEGEAI